MAEIDRGRLAALLGMFSSDFDGEVLNAARAAEKLRKSGGKSWTELLESGDAHRTEIAIEAARQPLQENERLRAHIERLEAGIERPPAPEPWAGSGGYRHSAAALLHFPQHLSDWERGFVASILRRHVGLTEKQITCLERIGGKVDRACFTEWRLQRRAA